MTPSKSWITNISKETNNISKYSVIEDNELHVIQDFQKPITVVVWYS